MDLNVEQIQLPIERIVISQLWDDGLPVHPDNVRAFQTYQIEMLANMLTVQLTVPTLPIQDKVVASYPTTWWDHVKDRLGWRHNRTEVNLKQFYVFPEIPAPLRGTHVRLATFTDVRETRWGTV